MRQLLYLLTPFLLAVNASGLALSQMGRKPVSVTGVVVAEGRNQPIQHATVRLSDSGADLIGQATTSDTGEFAFRGLQRGTYVLMFEADGFQSTEIRLDLTFTSDRGVTVYMKPVGKPLAMGSAGASISAHELSMPKTARDLVDSGRKKFYADKDPRGGLKDFEQAVSDAPGYYEAYCEIGMAYIAIGDKADAETNFRKSIEQSHNTYGEASVHLGALLADRGEVDAGEKAILRGVELNPNSWFGFYELSRLDLSRNRLELALKSAERAKALAPNAPIIYRLLTNIHMRQANYTAVISDIDAYLKLDPTSPAGVRAAEIREQVVQRIAKRGAVTGDSTAH